MRCVPAHVARRAFTLVELLVVIAIMGILMSLLLPAVQKAREAARVTACADNLRQLVIAANNYESRNRVFPPSALLAPNAAGSYDGWSAQALLLTMLEQSPLQSKINFKRSYEEAKNVDTADGKIARLSALRVPTFICPSEQRDQPRLSGTEAVHYPLNYGINLGVWFVYDPATQQGGPGAAYPNSRLSAGNFGDGLSCTLGFAEVKAWQPYYRNGGGSPNTPPAAADVAALGGEFKANSGHTEWVDGRAHQTGFTTTFAPNTNVPTTSGGSNYDVDWTSQQEGKSATAATYAAVTARSYHGGGVNVALLDGSTRWFTDEIDPGVWRAYSTRNGGELIPSTEQVK